MGYKLAIRALFYRCCRQLLLSSPLSPLWLGPYPRPMLPATSSPPLSPLLSLDTDPRFMLPEAESLRARRFTWSSSLRASGGAHRARSNRSFVVSWRLYRRLISATRAVLGHAAKSKSQELIGLSWSRGGSTCASSLRPGRYLDTQSSQKVRNYSPGYMEQAPSRGHEASPQSGLGVGCNLYSSS